MESSPCRFTSICEFGGSNPGNKVEFINAANNLGQVLAARKIHLVYGGGSLGLMGCVSSAVYIGGWKVLGIIPSALTVGHLFGRTLGKEVQVASLHERIARMLLNSEAFIALPRGFGTLENIFDIVSWSQLNIHRKPIGLLNVNGYFDGLLSFLDHAVEQKFLSLSARNFLLAAPTADQLIDQLQAFVPELDPVISQINWSIPNSSKKRKIDLTLRL